MRRFVWRDLDAKDRESALARPQAISDASLLENVRDILSDVRENGDEALRRLTPVSYTHLTLPTICSV